MNKINCDIINDILPLYVENMVSDATKKMVEEHIENCEDCSNKLVSMKKEMLIPADNNTNVILKIKKQIDRKNIQTAFLSGLIVLVIAVLTVSHLNSPISLAYSQEIVSITPNDDGTVSLTLGDEVAGYSIESLHDEDMTYYSMTCWNTLWNQYFSNSGKRTVTIDNQESNRNIDKIYYYSAENYQNGDLLIYSAESNTIGETGGMVTLPRLVLNYFLIFSAFLMAVGIVLCIVLRGKDKSRISLRITLLPLSYFLSSILVMAGHRDMYNSEYYFLRILILSIIMYLLIHYIVFKFILRKKGIS